MAYLKRWAPRALRPLELRRPVLLDGVGSAIRADAADAVSSVGAFDIAYLDPPYNQHRYFTNYHVWETLVAWDEPPHYGVACKRADARGVESRSAFDSRRTMGAALAQCIEQVDARLVVLSGSDEGWLSVERLGELASVRGEVAVLAFDSKRYVGAQIGVHNPAGERVGTVSHLRNTELLLVAGEAADVRRAVSPREGASARAG
jgi:adenine-specific DNA-methyltransferase